MPNPKSGILDLGDGTSPLAAACVAGGPETTPSASRIGNAVCELVTSFFAWRARRETSRVLASLDAATLRDLGITDIDSAVYGDPHDRVRGYDPDWWRTRSS